MILNEFARDGDEEIGEFDLDAFKIIYIAPMKVLVQEMVGNFSKYLKIFNVKVGELTGDAQMTKLQLSETQIIVTTPEKYDVDTHKVTETSYINLVRLSILSSTRFTYDERGPVLESIITHTIRHLEQTSSM